MARRLLRASSFCRPLYAPQAEVSIELLEKKGQESTVYGSAELLIQLSVKDGEIVWLSHDCLRIPAMLCIDDEMFGANVIKIPPTMHYFGHPTCTIQACVVDIKSDLPVYLRPLGCPVIKHLLFQEKKTTEYPPVGSGRRLVSSGVLVSILHDNQLFVYQIVNTVPCWTSSETEWILESHPKKVPIPRLPPLDQSVKYMLNEKFQRIPHPTLNKVTTELRMQSNSPASHKIVHVIGTTANHVDRCVEAAAHSLGRRYLKVNGLAAFAHASGRAVTTGSTVDKLTGCQAALEQAEECTPCVLHIINIEDELPQDDQPLRHMLEMRLWLMLTTALRLKSSAMPKVTSHLVPPLVVVLSTRKPLQIGPLSQNLVFAPIIMQEADDDYARFLWDDCDTFPHASQHLVGRTPEEICRWKRMWLYSNQDLASFLEQAVKPLNQKSSQIPGIHWQDIGGLAHVRTEVMDAIELPLKHPDLFQGTRRSGILLYGPPGTGKTLVAKAVATECGLPFFSVKGPELLGSYVGESEANVRQTFESARNVAVKNRAAVLFFDELDSLAPRRGGLGDGGGVMERVLATLLTELDRSDKVFLIGATNRPDLLDPSLLRPGRLDRRIFLGLPSEKDSRVQILAALIRKFNLEGDCHQVAFQVADQLSPRLSGADFSAVASGALVRSLERLCEAAELQVTPNRTLDDVLDEWGESVTPVVTSADLLAAAKNVVPSVTDDDLCRYQRLRDEFSSNEISY